MENFNSQLGYYGMKNSVNEIPEYGFKFTDDDVVFLVKHLFQCILDLNIKRKSSSAKTTEFEYKLVYTPSEDTAYDEKGWVSVKTLADIEKINFEPENFYVQHDEESAKKLRETIEVNSKKQDKASSDKKQEVKDAVDKKKKEASEKKTSKKEETTLA
jgi:hypothetical protein